jgi:SAM-dependent methyltransferase
MSAVGAAPVDLETAVGLIDPGPELGARIRAFYARQLGGVLPRRPSALDYYYRTVVAGERALEAYREITEAVPAAPGPVLDIGSGTGAFVLLAMRLGLDARGLEPGAEELALARERAERVLPGAPDDLFVAGVGEALPWPDAALGGALLHDVLEHVADWRAVLRECRRTIAPGGVLYVKGPSYAVRFVEPHYRVPWLPLLPKPVARRYLAALGRDVGYLEHLGNRRRGAVLAELRRLGFELEFPRRRKLREPERINRPLLRRVAAVGGRTRLAEQLADSPLQWTIDVVARVPPA